MDAVGARDPDEGFERSFDRAAAGDRALRGRVPAQPGGTASGSEVDDEIRRLDGVESSPDELTALASRAAGDPAARTELVERCLPIVLRMARRYAGRDVEEADLVQDGLLGILRAADRFDSARGVPFTAYASWWLRQSMQQAIAEQSRSIRLPTHVLWDIHRLREARGEIAAESGRSATPLELEQRLDWTAERLDDVVRAERPALSLDAPYAGDEAQVDARGDLTADPLSERAYEDVINSVTTTAIAALLATLTDRERQVLSWRFGLDGEELSLRQIARRLGVSAERVRQIERRGLIKLRAQASPGAGG
jgi:RNA polymerase sigma factor (sigma-70 family)